jgi:hypothetical protein
MAAFAPRAIASAASRAVSVPLNESGQMRIDMIKMLGVE